MALIELPSGHIVLLDEEDWDFIASFNWHRTGSSKKLHYAVRQEGNCHNGYHAKNILMHNQIMRRDASHFIVIDHLNGNGLDNRKSNFEIVSQSENVRRSYGH